MTVRGWSTGIGVTVTACWVVLAAVVLWQYRQTLDDRERISALWAPAVAHASLLARAQAGASATLSDAVLRSRSSSTSSSPTDTPSTGTPSTGTPSTGTSSAGDAAARLQPWLDRMRRSATSLGLLLAAEDVERSALQRALASQEQWLQRDVRPTMRALAQGDLRRAGLLTTGQSAFAATEAMLRDSLALQARVQGRLSSQGSEITRTVNRLGQLLFLALTAVIVIIGSGMLAVRRGILTPLDTVRTHLRQAAREPDHRHPIPGTGPAEISGVARDAESLRRELVAEIDHARAARDALHVHAPLVDAVREQLYDREPPRAPGLDVYASTRPTQGVIGGDFWDLVARPDGAWCLVLADVSGHGWDCGLLALQTRAVISSWLRTPVGLDEVLEQVSRSVQGQERTIPMTLIDFEPARDRLTYANAGHPPPLLLRASGEICELGQTGPLVSCLGRPSTGWQVGVLPWRAGDVLVAYSDGLSEALEGSDTGDPHGTYRDPIRFSITGVHDLLTKNSLAIGEAVLADIRSRTGEWDDDVTLIVARRCV